MGRIRRLKTGAVGAVSVLLVGALAASGPGVGAAAGSSSRIWLSNVGNALDSLAADGSDLRVENSITWNGVPSVSPDRTRIAYTGLSVPSGQPQVWVANVDGTNAILAPQSDGAWNFPVWSSDGTAIAFLTAAGVTRFWPATGVTAVTPVQFFPTDWSTDGRFMVGSYAKDCNDGTSSVSNRNFLSVLDLSTGGVHTADLLPCREAGYAIDEYFYPRLSPDGKSAVAYRQGGTRSIDVVDLATGAVIRSLPFNSCCMVDWSPDGSSVAYVQYDGNNLYSLRTWTPSDGTNVALVSGLPGGERIDWGEPGALETRASIVMEPEAGLEQLVGALSAGIPALGFSSTSAALKTVSVPACPSGPVPQPADSANAIQLMLGNSYVGVDGTTILAQPAACRPDAVTAYGP